MPIRIPAPMGMRWDMENIYKDYSNEAMFKEILVCHTVIKEKIRDLDIWITKENQVLTEIKKRLK
jgi:hypothetical protein